MHCDIGNHEAQEARLIPHGYAVYGAGWICPDCWREQWAAHWPEWRTLTDYASLHTNTFGQLELFMPDA